MSNLENELLEINKFSDYENDIKTSINSKIKAQLKDKKYDSNILFIYKIPFLVAIGTVSVLALLTYYIIFRESIFAGSGDKKNIPSYFWVVVIVTLAINLIFWALRKRKLKSIITELVSYIDFDKLKNEALSKFEFLHLSQQTSLNQYFDYNEAYKFNKYFENSNSWIEDYKIFDRFQGKVIGSEFLLTEYCFDITIKHEAYTTNSGFITSYESVKESENIVQILLDFLAPEDIIYVEGNNLHRSDLCYGLKKLEFENNEFNKKFKIWSNNEIMANAIFSIFSQENFLKNDISSLDKDTTFYFLFKDCRLFIIFNNPLWSSDNFEFVKTKAKAIKQFSNSIIKFAKSFYAIFSYVFCSALILSRSFYHFSQNESTKN